MKNVLLILMLLLSACATSQHIKEVRFREGDMVLIDQTDCAGTIDDFYAEGQKYIVILERSCSFLNGEGFRSSENWHVGVAENRLSPLLPLDSR